MQIVNHWITLPGLSVVLAPTPDTQHQDQDWDSKRLMPQCLQALPGTGYPLNGGEAFVVSLPRLVSDYLKPGARTLRPEFISLIGLESGACVKQQKQQECMKHSHHHTHFACRLRGSSTTIDLGKSAACAPPRFAQRLFCELPRG